MTTLTKGLPAILVCAACGGASGPPEVKSALERNEAPSQEHLAELVASNTAFAVDMYKFAAAQEGNVFLSPHSITTTLAMTYAGAAGATASQMATALHFDLPPADLHEALNALDLALESRGESSGGSIPFELQSANSVWGMVGWPISAGFLDTLAVNYDAGVHVVNFSDGEGSRAQINDWVADHTGGHIDQLMPPNLLNGDTRLVLTNAMYFAAAWTDPFDRDDTEDAVFHTPTGDKVVPTMRQTSADLRLGYGSDFLAVELPYDGDEVSMVFVLPADPAAPLAQLEGTLSADKIAEITGALTPTEEATLALAKFTFRATFPLTEALTNAGMVDAFDPARADLSLINTDKPLYIWRALHEGFIQVDEEGTRAAAATAVVVGDDASPPIVELNRPFLMFIRDIATNQILFIGRVLDPTVGG